MTLIDRLSKLDGPDREVDAQIYIQFNIPAERAGRIDYSNGMVGWYPKDGPYVSAITVPAYTASVDAAIALAEKVLPGWWVQHMGQCTSGWKVRIETQGKSIPDGMNFDYAPSPAIAICIAILRAKEASKP